MKDTILHSTLRELQRVVRIARIWVVFAAVVFLFAVTGPFGTFDQLPFHARLGYWLVVQLLSWGIALIFVSFFDNALESVWVHALPRMLTGAALAAVPTGVVVALVDAAFVGAPVSAASIRRDMVTALPVALALCLLAWMALVRRHEPAGEQPPIVARPAEPPGEHPRHAAILDRLPVEKRGRLVRLEVQDHYVLVVTGAGGEMVLMRLADAVRETAPVDGMQVHRSHWVAKDGIARLERRRGGKLVIVTTDGVVVPVSRANIAGVRNWIGGARRVA